MPASQSEAVARRFAQLSAELAAVRETEGVPTRPRLSVVPLGAEPSSATAGEEPSSGAPDTEPRPPARVLEPGRHASRRPGRWAAVLPEPVRGRVAFGPAAVSVLAVVVAAGLALTAWWVLAGQPSEVTAPARLLPASGSVEALVSPAAAAASPVTELVVDVTGRVRRPGIVVLDQGARVVDAIEAAGGARPGTRLGSLNQARLLVDGEQVVVGVPPATGVAASVTPGAPGTPGGVGDLVSLNHANVTELESLPEVGPVTAEAIVAWREQNGAFSAIDELLEVDGIGEKTLQRLTPYVTL